MDAYLNYLKEQYESDILRVLVNSLDVNKIKPRILSAIKNDKLNVMPDSIFVSDEPKPNTIEGYFVYSLTKPDDKYTDHKKYYIGKFKYSLNKNKLIDYTESTKYKFNDVASANNYVTTELKSIQLESEK